MKTTVEIADDLFERAQKLVQREKTTFRALTEEGLRLVIAERRKRRLQAPPPLVTYGSGGATPEFEDWSWDRIRDEVYRGHGT